MKRLLFLIFVITLFAPSTFVFAATVEECDSLTIECHCPSTVTTTQHRAYHQANRGAATQITEQSCKEDCLALSRTTEGVSNWSLQCKIAGALTPINQGSLITSTSSSSSGVDDVLPELNIEIPGYTQEALAQSRDTSGNANVLGVYINAVYNWLLIAGAVVAILVMMVGGLQYTLARGNAGAIGQAKSLIENAAIGMVLLLGAYVVAYLIDPSLTRFESLNPDSIERSVYFPPDGEDINIIANVQPLDEDYVKIEGEHIIATSSENLVHKTILTQLQSASKQFYEKTNTRVIVTSGLRTLVTQETFFYEKCIANSGRCSVPTCTTAPTSLVKLEGGKYVLQGALTGVTDRNTIISTLAANGDKARCNHTRGIAVDAWHEGQQKGFRADPDLMRSLSEVMIANGFCRLDSEPWHFEYRANQSSTNCKTTNIAPSYTRSGKLIVPDSNCRTWSFQDHKCVLYK